MKRLFVVRVKMLSRSDKTRQHNQHYTLLAKSESAAQSRSEREARKENPGFMVINTYSIEIAPDTIREAYKELTDDHC